MHDRELARPLAPVKLLRAIQLDLFGDFLADELGQLSRQLASRVQAGEISPRDALAELDGFAAEHIRARVAAWRAIACGEADPPAPACELVDRPEPAE